MEYKIAKVLGVYDSKFPDSKKYDFMLENYPHKVSAFSKFPMEAGKTITGEITINGQYHNFKWGKKDSSPAANNAATAELKNTLTLGILPKLAKIEDNQFKILAALDRISARMNLDGDQPAF